MKQIVDNNNPENGFSILGFITNGRSSHSISSINHYHTYHKHKTILEKKFEGLNYGKYGYKQYLEEVGYDKYCKDIWKVARDPKTIHSLKFRVKDKHEYLGEQLQQGDILKIGRIKFKLRKFNLNKFGNSNANPFPIANSNQDQFMNNHPNVELARHS